MLEDKQQQEESRVYTILWQFEVRDEKTTEFLHAYGSEGKWAELFRQAEGYQGTELLHSTSKPNNFITIDRWKSAEDFDNFQEQYGAKYSALDAALSELIVSETKLGSFESEKN